MSASVPYLRRVTLLTENVPDMGVFPFSLPFVRALELELRAAVTFFVGENGSGKSTLIEGIAELCGFPAFGGGKNELADLRHETSPLAPALRPTFAKRPRDGYFFRAETLAQFANLLDERKDDPDFRNDPYMRYGGQSLHERSHGEAFLALFVNRIEQGLFLLDEPESALSPQRQLALLARMAELVDAGRSQFIVATHSPILLTFPGAEILSFDVAPLRPTKLEQTSHYQITKGILDCPERYWKHLRKP